MKILAFDTSSTACSVALLIKDPNGHDVINFTHQVAPMQQAKQILPAINQLLAEQGIALSQLDAIAYGAGPGSFTGIRIAASVAQGLGFSADIPVISISSLAAMAQAAYLEHQAEHIFVALDARQKQIYWAYYQATQTGLVELIGTEQICFPNQIPRASSTEGYGVGDAWVNYQDDLLQALGLTSCKINISQLPTAQALLSLAKKKYEKSEFISVNNAIPVYLR
ncbi:MAG: hypothetical protein ACD_46C00484G0015 [uncultured bacterium]|nr:MAG: hypothetical protein ACD_46C00484G0015 [uncultured bacterium]